MKKSIGVLIAVLLLAILGPSTLAPPAAHRDYPIRPVDFTRVVLDDIFWAPRIETNRTSTVPFALGKNEETGRVDNFRKAAGLMPGAFRGKRYNDSDVYKVMEGAAFTLMIHPDPELERRLDELIATIGRAQEPDGYLFTTRTIDPAHPAPGAGPERWSNLRVSHELYVVGHMYEAAVAHALATGKKTFLEIATKNADLLARTFGPSRKHGFPGHQEIEIGLAKLTRVTGNAAYLDLAKFFLDERGRYHQGPFHEKNDPFAVYDSEEYMQNHKPVLEQDEAVGHSVRAMYMYAGMADVAALGGYPEYVAAIDRLWANVTEKKMYLTGGVGARHTSEAFGDAYELPNREAYTETCAAVGNALWNQRMFLLHGDAKYADVLERVMYNGLLSGVGLRGDLFFYQNPLESAGRVERSPWFEVACCPPNVLRFLPSVPGYFYAVRDDVLYVNLFAGGRGEVEIGGTKVVLAQETRYPWEGEVKIAVDPASPVAFTLNVRIPGWARNEAVPGGLYRFLDAAAEKPSLKVNGRIEDAALDKGYASMRRKWAKGDVVELVLPMPVRRVVADEAVQADAGRVALQRGPLVYCLEGVDNGGRILDLSLADGAALEAEFRPDVLNGVVVLSGQAAAGGKAKAFLAIPYYAWANREIGEMAVWRIPPP